MIPTNEEVGAVTNSLRADRALEALRTFERETGSGRDTSFYDLLCNMRHLADRAGWDWRRLLAHADELYAEELATDEAGDDGTWPDRFPAPVQASETGRNRGKGQAASSMS